MPDDKQMISEELRVAIVQTLSAKGINECPMCKSNAFSLTDGFIGHFLSRSTGDLFTIGGEKHVVPCASLVCQRCGFMSMHSLQELGLLDRFKEGKENA